MATDDRMTINERRKYLKRMAPRYLAADRAGQSQLLTEMEQVTQLHRKSLLRLLHAPTLERQRRRTQRGRTYGPDVAAVVRVVWESLDFVCAERLTPNLVPLAQHLAHCGELELPAAAAQQLATISRSTVQRLLARFQQDTPRLPRRGPEVANRVAQAIPMGRIPWNLAEPGHFEVDLVHHCGPSTAGDYVHTLQLIDSATGWSERVAVLGRGQRAMVAGFEAIQARLPFPIRHLHPDNGSEFLNNHLVRYWGESITGLTLSRSRPYHKNDNRKVEQKNDTLVRHYLGHRRLDTIAQCTAVNRLYDDLWVFYNLFQPVLHLIEKAMVDGRLKRRWDTAASPYQRVLAAMTLPPEQCARLADLHARTNPRRLRLQIYDHIDQLWDDDWAESELVQSAMRTDLETAGKTTFQRKETASLR